MQRGPGAACPFSGGDLLGLKQGGVAPGGQGIDRGFGDGADPRAGAGNGLGGRVDPFSVRRAG